MKIIIVGAGEVGFHIASRLSLEKKNVVIIEKDAAALKRITESIDVSVVEGSGSSPSVLREAGIEDADILLAVTDSDETNLVSCLMADLISPSTKKLSRIRTADFDPYHDILKKNPPHIDTIINPEIEVVKAIEQMMDIPGAVDVGEFADGRIKLVGIKLDEGSDLTGTRLDRIDRGRIGTSFLIAAIVREGRLIIPGGKDRLRSGDIVYIVCENRELIKTLEAFGKKAKQVKKAVIIGGGRIGSRLAYVLEKKGIYIKIIDKDAAVCTFLSESLNRSVILHGNGSDKDLLLQENVDSTDFFIALTGDEETNILSSLLAKSLGVEKTITRVARFGNAPLMSTIGIDLIVSTRLSAVNSILQHIRRGKVLSDITIKNEQAEMLEAIALPTSGIVGKPLKNISFAKGALVVGIMRGEKVIIPRGDSIIEPDDRILIFSKRDSIPAIEKILTVKLDYF